MIQVGLETQLTLYKRVYTPHSTPTICIAAAVLAEAAAKQARPRTALMSHLQVAAIAVLRAKESVRVFGDLLRPLEDDAGALDALPQEQRAFISHAGRTKINDHMRVNNRLRDPRAAVVVVVQHAAVPGSRCRLTIIGRFACPFSSTCTWTLPCQTLADEKNTPQYGRCFRVKETIRENRPQNNAKLLLRP